MPTVYVYYVYGDLKVKHKKGQSYQAYVKVRQFDTLGCLMKINIPNKGAKKNSF